VAFGRADITPAKLKGNAVKNSLNPAPTFGKKKREVFEPPPSGDGEKGL